MDEIAAIVPFNCRNFQIGVDEKWRVKGPRDVMTSV